jgi:hypothetical protein
MKSGRRHFVKQLSALFILTLLPVSRARAATGEFKGSVVTRWADDGRNMTLLQPFEYIDPNGTKWPVPPGTTLDGASIPRFFWSLIGGPFEGRYRNASVIHDFYCQVQTRPFPIVHRVFYDAMVTSGLTDRTSWLMYKAVDQFGPRWADPQLDPKCAVVDENYDFTGCARNAKPPPPAPVPTTRSDRESIEAFLHEMEGEANPDDIGKLRKELDKM